MPEAIQVRVHGRVQAVGYREFCRRVAKSLDVTGWARNESDGTVVVYAEGSAEDLERFRERLKEGPRLARVDDLEVSAVEPEGAVGFDIGW